MASRTRIDQLLVERGLVASRDRARRLILAGQVLVDDRVVDKAGAAVAVDANIRLKVPDHPYVGRGGLKLEGALDDFDLDVAGLRCLDVGASTGGFTDCLLQRGAAHVVATDVGSNQLAWKLRQDPRVSCHEKTDARSLTPDLVGEPVDLCVVDVSFISLRLVLPSVRPLLAEGAPILALVKPQFEVGRDRVGKGGRVQDDALRQAAVDAVGAEALALGFEEVGRHDSRLEGAKAGNREVFLLVRPQGRC